MIKWLTALGLVNILEVLLVLGLTFWREHFWNAISTKDIHGFFFYLGIFAVLTLVLCFVTSSSVYFGTRAAISWREKLSALANKFKTSKIENVSQRIQADCFDYPNLCIVLGGGAFKAFLYVLLFSLSIIFNFNSVWLIWIIGYSILSTVIAHYIGAPLVHLNYKNQMLEATYRNSLTKLNFRKCIDIQLKLAKKLKHLQYFQSFYGQLGVIIPLLIIAPEYFSTTMTLGHLMQANSTMGTLSDSLSYGINTFDQFNKLRSCKKRLKELKII
ncbi:MAG: SbmA/BacA-like family transporter [Bacteroidota bacterium]